MLQGEIAREIDHAQFDEGCWERVMAGIARWVGAAGAYMWSPLEPAGARSFGKTVDLPPEMSERYFRDFHARDLLLQAARARELLHAGTVVNTHGLLPTQVYEASAFYREFLADYGMYTFLACILTDEGDAMLGPRTHIALSRPRSAPPFSQEDERKLASVLPQMRTALTSHWRMRSNGLLGEWNEQLLAQIDQPFFLLSRGGRMLFANQVGLNLVRDCRALSLRDGLLCRGVNDTPLIEQIDPKRETGFDLVALPPDCPAMKVVPLLPARNTQSMFRWFPRAAYVVLPQLLAELRTPPSVEAFGGRHGLTRAERHVLTHIIEGRSPRATSHALGLSVHTVRAHLAHIFQKTGLRNQRELLAAVLRARAV